MSDSFRAAVFIVFSGGFQDAYTFCCRDEVFANAQTGNVVLLSSSLFLGEWKNVLKYLVPVVSFLIGTAVAEIVHIRMKNCEKIHWRQIILLVEILLLFGVGFLNHEFDSVANAVVSFVCALQVQSFHKVRGHAYASTMCIGNLRSGTEALCAYFRSKDMKVLEKAATYFGVILVFAVGAGVGTVLTRLLGIRSVWLCCVSLFVSFLMMFAKEEKRARESV